MPDAETCARGHPWEVYATWRTARRGRLCLACERARTARYRAKARPRRPRPRHHEKTFEHAAQVARLTRAGRSAQQIAWDLHVSARTVVRHRAIAREVGLLPPLP